MHEIFVRVLLVFASIYYLRVTYGRDWLFKTYFPLGDASTIFYCHQNTSVINNLKIHIINELVHFHRVTIKSKKALEGL